jgi:GH15 family glucan-1,4-alpha-glucosidase
VDRAVKAVERHGVEGPVDRWRALRKTIHDEVLREGFDTELNSFVQYFGSKELDASLLMLPLVGFVKPTDPRMLGTVRAIEERLVSDGVVARYRTDPKIDGLPPGEGAFLACTFWLADNLALQGRTREARETFERLLDLRNDVGLLAEEWEPREKRFLGNFPQAFSHVGLVNTARNLCRPAGPAEARATAD